METTTWKRTLCIEPKIGMRATIQIFRSMFSNRTHQPKTIWIIWFDEWKRKKKSSEFEVIFFLVFTFICMCHYRMCTPNPVHKYNINPSLNARVAGYISNIYIIHNEIENERKKKGTFVACIKHLFAHTKMMMIELMETKKSATHRTHKCYSHWYTMVWSRFGYSK